MIDTFLFHRILNPILVKIFQKMSIFGKNLRFRASINHQIWHLWSHFGDMNLSRKTHVFAKLFLVYVFIHLTESSHQTYASDKVP